MRHRKNTTGKGTKNPTVTEHSGKVYGINFLPKEISRITIHTEYSDVYLTIHPKDSNKQHTVMVSVRNMYVDDVKTSGIADLAWYLGLIKDEES